VQPQGAPPTNAKSLPGVPFALPRRPPTVHGTACSGTAPGPRSLAQIPDFIVTGQSPAQPKRITVLWVMLLMMMRMMMAMDGLMDEC